MIFKRKIYRELLDWKRTSRGRSALLIEGARRVGKSTIVKQFAENEYGKENYLILDFALENKDVRDNFENISDLNTFFRNLFVLKHKKLEPRKSLIIFDEVQQFPAARQAIKYLVQDGRFDYIETGSLISIRHNVRDIVIPSEEHKIKMYPMDFEEFLDAQGDAITAQVIQDAWVRRIPLGDKIHQAIMKQLRTYMAVGGMPQSVNALVQGRSYREIDAAKRDILSLYEEDLHKHDREFREKAAAVFKAIPGQLSSHFSLAGVDKNARYDAWLSTMDYISESMMANCCRNITYPDVAPELYADNRNFKLYMGDTGLLVTQILRSGSMTSDELYKALIFDRLSLNQGMIFENLVSQMLTAQGRQLFFHEFEHTPRGSERSKKYEIDFMLVEKNKIMPIEVKSSGYKSHKSLDMLREKYPVKIGERVIIYTKDFCRDGETLCVPVYMTPFL